MAVGLHLVSTLVALGTAAVGGSATSTSAATSSEVAAPAVPAEKQSTSPAGASASGQVAAAEATVQEDTQKNDVVSRFAGSVLFAQLSANLNTFDAGLQQMQNPTVESVLLLLPRYRVVDWLQLRGRFSLAYEFTEADQNTYANELQVGDGTIGAMFTGIPELFGVKSVVGAQFTLPFSKAARAKTLIFSPGLVAEVGRELKGVAGGTLSFKATGVYSHPVYSEMTPNLLDQPAYAPHCYGGAADCFDQLSGVANVRDVLSWSLLGTGAWGPFSATLWFNLSHQFPYQFSDLPGVERDPNRPDVRVLSFASVALGWEITDWIGAELSYSMTRNLMSGDGTYGNVLYDRYQDMRVNLGATLDLEHFYRSL